MGAGRAALFAIKLGYPPDFFVELALEKELLEAGVKVKMRVEQVA